MRRKTVEHEADFYGAMDGASKFVRGDAVAAVVIIVLNIVGGFAMGMVSGKGDIMTTLKTYTLVTVGEGLVAQIPALLISTASGLMVTRAAGEGGMSRDLVRQVFGSPRSLIIASVLLLFFIPLGFPPLQTLAISGALGASAYGMIRARKQAEAAVVAQAAQASAPKAPAATPESVMPLLAVDTLELEIGYGLMPLVDAASGGDLLDRITMIRRQTATELGLDYSKRPYPRQSSAEIQRLPVQAEGRGCRQGNGDAELADDYGPGYGHRPDYGCRYPGQGAGVRIARELDPAASSGARRNRRVHGGGAFGGDGDAYHRAGEGTRVGSAVAAGHAELDRLSSRKPARRWWTS